MVIGNAMKNVSKRKQLYCNCKKKHVDVFGIEHAVKEVIDGVEKKTHQFEPEICMDFDCDNAQCMYNKQMISHTGRKKVQCIEIDESIYQSKRKRKKRRVRRM